MQYNFFKDYLQQSQFYFNGESICFNFDVGAMQFNHDSDLHCKGELTDKGLNMG